MASDEVCATLPKTTCATASGATPACASAAFAACTPRSVAERSRSVPPYVPKGVRLAPRKTTSVEVADRMGSSRSSSNAAEQHVHGRGEEHDRERGDAEGERVVAAQVAPSGAAVPRA